jgi:ubiquinone/menaquinone biosynthesis C-methylase UbiE
MRTRRFLLLGGLATGAGALAVLASPAIHGVRRSLHTSSSPGAGSYDAVAGFFLGGWYDDIAADCAAALDGRPSSEILEIGPGPGHLAERLLALLPDARWTGVDVDPAMLDAARHRLQAAGHAERATVLEADVAAMPLAEASFDLVVSSLSAHHWADAEAGFREIRRVLRPGGHALVFDLPAGLAHLEGGTAGLGAADLAFEAPVRRRFRGAGPWTLAWRVELTA